MGYDIEDERTTGQGIHVTWDKAPEDLCFVALSGPDQGKRFLVFPPGGVIGREPGAAVQCSDLNVSRRHAELEIGREARVLLTDLDSRNGVFINGVQIKRAEVFDGNHIRLSNDTVLRARFQDPAETELLEQLQFAVTQDKLTGLPNRRYVNDRLAQEMSRARRHGELLSVVLLDIDNFHKVNDADGREGGDALMVAIAAIARAEARMEDVVARYGGDEIVVILNRASVETAQVFGERLRAAVAGRVFDVGDVPIRATVTIGVAGYDGTEEQQPARDSRKQLDPSQVTQLLDRADSALYRGKSAGKDRVAIWIAE